MTTMNLPLSSFHLLWLSIVLLLLSPSFSPVNAQSNNELCQHYAPPAVIKGNKIFLSTTGEYLPIKGINYYPRPNAGDLTLGNSQDFYTEVFRASWERDIRSFVNLGVNAIRLYAVDPGSNHDAFMCALKAAGIYAIVGLAADCEDCAVQWQDPPNCYPTTLYHRGTYVISQFSKYENVLGFSAGNEVSLSAESALGNLPCQKKFLKDMREYVRDCVAAASMRHIPVGIIFADHERAVKAQYYNCVGGNNGDDEDDSDLEMAEFVGINAYLHCDGSATDPNQLIGYETLRQDFISYGMTVPVLWTEFGCLNESFETIDDYQAQRNFLQVEALFSPVYEEVFNGGFVFEYSTEKVYSEQMSPWPFVQYGTGNYGVGFFSPENCNHEDIPCDYVPMPQFQTLANRYNAVPPGSQSGVMMDDYVPLNHNPPACPVEVPPIDAFDWPTDAIVQEQRASRQCPLLVPVYCVGIPGECVTVPLEILPTPPMSNSTTPTVPTTNTSNETATEPNADGTTRNETATSAPTNLTVENIPAVSTEAPTTSTTLAPSTNTPTLRATTQPTSAFPTVTPTVVALASPTSSSPTISPPTTPTSTKAPAVLTPNSTTSAPTFPILVVDLRPSTNSVTNEATSAGLSRWGYDLNALILVVSSLVTMSAIIL